MGSITINVPVSHLVLMPNGERRFYNMLTAGATYTTWGDGASIVIPVDLYTAWKIGMVQDYEIPDHVKAYWKLSVENV